MPRDPRHFRLHAVMEGPKLGLDPIVVDAGLFHLPAQAVDRPPPVGFRLSSGSAEIDAIRRPPNMADPVLRRERDDLGNIIHRRHQHVDEPPRRRPMDRA